MENDLSLGAAWMNGTVIPISQAAIPVNDWGLVHSDITYDVVPVIDGAFFRFDEYLARFLSSMENLHLDPGMSKRDIQAALHQMVGKSSLRDSYVAMVCSRGKPKIAGSRDPRDCENHFFAWCVPYVHIIKPEIVEKGATAWIAQNAYRIPENSVNPRVKNYHWGDFTQGIFEAKDKNYETVIFLDYDGNVTEGPGFNVYYNFNDPDLRTYKKADKILKNIKKIKKIDTKYKNFYKSYFLNKTKNFPLIDAKIAISKDFLFRFSR